ncbi:MAG: hypothetical protein FWE49_05410 [Synergistaceae bacterium]|nr:hypothetical protein [Synergistaceae bacterium]
MKKNYLLYSALLLCTILVLLWAWGFLLRWMVIGTMALVAVLWATRKWTRK